MHYSTFRNTYHLLAYNNVDLIEKGSITAKSGFINEQVIESKFNNYHCDIEAKKWLKVMGFEINTIKQIEASVIRGYKTDITIKILTDVENTVNLSLKRMSSNAGFNQVDKRWVKSYKLLWNFGKDVEFGLKLFTGEVEPNFITKDRRRGTLIELPERYREAIIKWFTENKSKVVSDILMGHDKYPVHWLLVTKYDIVKRTETWALKDIKTIINHYEDGKVIVSKNGSLLIGKILMQRKGGDAGRKTAKMLQFKIDPNDIFDI